MQFGDGNSVERIPMNRLARVVRRLRIGTACLWCVAVCVVVSGCQTSRSFDDGCPGIYSGVRYYNSQIESMPWDGKIFFAIDLPFSAIFDTLAVPFTAFADRKKPREGWVPGCRWARK